LTAGASIRLKRFKYAQLGLNEHQRVCVTLPHSPAIGTFQIQPFALSSSTSGFQICVKMLFIAAHVSIRRSSLKFHDVD
jgi:hypothetical protein